MGLAESSQHVPNPLFGWLPSITASFAYKDSLVSSTSWVRTLPFLGRPNLGKDTLKNTTANFKTVLENEFPSGPSQAPLHGLCIPWCLYILLQAS